MTMKAMLLMALLPASAAIADETEYLCTSEINGEIIQIFQDADRSEARLVVQNTEGAASVAHGLDGVTFIHIKTDEVWTLALHFPTMTYELSTHGATSIEDHGHCTKRG
ncbi:hypothetical protein SAMN05444358_11138 [Ruegeria halocynthiae]|uniref:Membrane-bound lysozyme-inhibitor of c-type lysozyme n=1 Tax=Ruegeria halocynthiae TaxID=985054 RepID=A0A1H3EEZ6_9RHOB|nr:hypothetical protein [Ruegeria halocynthiae]SDX77313.1 hypothetical protein SAMN05444358_11138 [Ruegeria halocynthiae]